MSDRAPRRRRPQQERSREMVERILAATRSVLVERGYEGASTNRIAAVAGISQGSLYQYFPDKEAVVEEALDRYVDELEARITRAFVAGLAGRDVATQVRSAVGAIIDSFEEEPALLAVVAARDAHGRGDRRRRFAERIDDIAATALLHRAGPVRDEAAARSTAWILVRCIEHVTLSYVLERPPIPRTVLLDQVTVMVVGHLEAVDAALNDR